jgi:hypothetical protein
VIDLARPSPGAIPGYASATREQAQGYEWALLDLEWLAHTWQRGMGERAHLAGLLLERAIRYRRNGGRCHEGHVLCAQWGHFGGRP